MRALVLSLLIFAGSVNAQMIDSTSGTLRGRLTLLVRPEGAAFIFQVTSDAAATGDQLALFLYAELAKANWCLNGFDLSPPTGTLMQDRSRVFNGMCRKIAASGADAHP